MKTVRSFIISLLFFTSTLSAQKLELVKEVHEGAKIQLLIHSPCNNIFITGDDKGYICVYNDKDLTEIKRFKAHPNEVSSIAFNSDCSKMITASHKGQVSIWDPSTWERLHVFTPAYPARVTFAVFDPSGKHVYFDLNQSVLKINSNLVESIERIYYSPRHLITCAVVSPDNKYLVIGSEQTIKIFEFSTKNIIKEIGFCSSYVNEITFITETLIASWCQDGTLNHWDIKKQSSLLGKPLMTRKAGKNNTWSHLYVSPDKKYLVTGNGTRQVSLWEPMTGKLLVTADAHKDTVRAFAFSLDSKFLFTGGFDGTVKKWKLSDSLEQPVDTLKDTVDTVKEVVKIPQAIENRKVEKGKLFEVSSNILEAEVWDDNVDGDIISLNWNNNWMLKNYEVTKERKKVLLPLSMNGENILVLHAENLGRTPPNTARISFYDGKETHIIKVSSDLAKSGSVRFVYKPER